MLITLDATKRGQAPATLANTLTEHLLASAGVRSQRLAIGYCARALPALEAGALARAYEKALRQLRGNGSVFELAGYAGELVSKFIPARLSI